MDVSQVVKQDKRNSNERRDYRSGQRQSSARHFIHTSRSHGRHRLARPEARGSRRGRDRRHLREDQRRGGVSGPGRGCSPSPSPVPRTLSRRSETRSPASRSSCDKPHEFRPERPHDRQRRLKRRSDWPPGCRMPRDQGLQHNPGLASSQPDRRWHNPDGFVAGDDQGARTPSWSWFGRSA